MPSWRPNSLRVGPAPRTIPDGIALETGLDGGAAFIPACPAERLGDPSFCADHRLRYPYVAGGMANGIGSTDVVAAMAREGMLAFFGSAGLTVAEVEAAIDRIERSLGRSPSAPTFGFNLIHSPQEPALEAAVVDLYLRRGISLVEASAYLRLTLPLIRYRVAGIHRDADGRIVAPHRVIAKVSRVEVAERFFSPPPEKFLRELVSRGEISEEQARLAEAIPVAQDLTAEADSGGHTDNQPLVALLPTMLALAGEMMARHGYVEPLRVGAAGGIGAPAAAAAAFAMGAAYLLTGSINQACVEAGTSPTVKAMLAEARQADVAMAPAADMFEMGVRVQVLKRGTMFAPRATRLYDLYRAHDSLDALPADQRALLERDVFRAPLDEIWRRTRAFFAERDPAQVAKAEADPKRKMGLVFRWYLGLSSQWANAGEPTRKVDYQIWCGPAMGAFNQWVRGTFLESPEERRVAVLGLNLLWGAAVLQRVQMLRAQGVVLVGGPGRIGPIPAVEVRERLRPQA